MWRRIINLKIIIALAEKLINCTCIKIEVILEKIRKNYHIQYTTSVLNSL